MKGSKPPSPPTSALVLFLRPVGGEFLCVSRECPFIVIILGIPQLLLPIALVQLVLDVEVPDGRHNRHSRIYLRQHIVCELLELLCGVFLRIEECHMKSQPRRMVLPFLLRGFMLVCECL